MNITFFKEFFGYFYPVLKYLFTPYIYILFFLGSFQPLHSQNFNLKISIKDSVHNSILKQLDFRKTHQTNKSILLEVDSLKYKFERFGYLNNRLDSIVNIDSTYTAYFFLGKSTKQIRIYYDNKILARKEIFRFTKKITDEYFEIAIENISIALSQLVQLFESQGKSFTKVQLKEISFTNNIINAKLDLNVSEERRIYDIVIKGYENFPKTFLKNYLNLKKETIFTTQKVENISQRIKALPFVSETKSPEILFTKDSTYLYLYLKKQKANKFDGLIGFTSDQNSNGLDFNGYLDLELNNILNSGEYIKLNWKNNGNDQQFFTIGLQLPFLFNSPITPDFALNIYKQDSTFINTDLNFSLGYLINYRNKVKLFYESRSSNDLLDTPINNVVNFDSSQFGIGYSYQILNNNILFPEKFNLNLKTSLGSRKSQGVKTNQSEVRILANYLWSFNFRNHLFIQNETNLLNSDNYLTNELYRIGGVNSIRGFNEENIFASLYSIINLEYRYNASATSYIYSISDAAFVRNQLSNLSEQLFSLGLGYAFTTNFGLINFSYAIGKFENSPFDFNDSRFHLKLISFF